MLCFSRPSGAKILATALIAFPFMLAAAPSNAETELTLQQAVDAALGHDAQFKAAVSTFSAEREQVDQARSRLLPQVSLSASYAFEDIDNIYTDTSSLYYNPTEVRSTGESHDVMWRLSFDQALLDWSSYKAFKASEAKVKAAGFRLNKAEQELVYRTTERYLNVLYKAQLVYLNQTIHDALSLKLEQAQRKSDLGIGDQLERLEVQARKDLARTDLLQAESDLESEQTKLNIITGQVFTPPRFWVEEVHRIVPPELDQSEEDWLTLARENFDYQESLANAESADLQVASNKAGHYPTVSLGLSYSSRESDDPFRDREGLMASVEMRLPLYAGGRTESSVRESLARMQAQQAVSEGVLAETEQQISLAYAKLKNTAKRLQALEQSVLSSQKYLEAAERGQTLNLRSQVDVLDARTQMLDVQIRLAEALNQFLLAELDLRFQSGQLTREHVSYYDSLFVQIDSAR